MGYTVKMSCCENKSLDNSRGGQDLDLDNIVTNTLIVNDTSNIDTLTVTGNTILNNVQVTGSANIKDIVCETLEASLFTKVKNASNDFLSTYVNPSSLIDPNQRRGAIRSSSTAFGFDLLTEGSNKSIKIESNNTKLSTSNVEGPAFVSVGGSSALGGISILANQAIDIESLTQAITQTSTTSINLNGRLALNFSSLFGSIGMSCLTTMNLTSGPILPTILPGININSSQNVVIGTTLGGIGLTSGVLFSNIPNPGNITIQASQTAGIGGLINIQALSTFPGIQPPNAIALTTDAGIIALTSGAGGVAVTTGLGVVAITTGAGAIQLRTGVGLLGAVSSILLETVLGGAITLKANTDAIYLLAPLGGVNAGSTTTPLGQFSVYTSDGVTSTANISMRTNTGGFLGAGNILMDATQAHIGNLSLYSKGTIQITSNNTASGGVTNTTGGIYLNTSASSGSVYDWRFPAGPGSVGQVLASNGSGAAQSWSNVPTLLNGNISVNNVFFGYFAIVTTPNPYNMTISSPAYTRINATGPNHTIYVPDATTLALGAQYYFNSDGTGTVNVKRFGSGTIANLGKGSMITALLVDNSTAAGVWDHHTQLPHNVYWDDTTMSTTSTISIEPATTTTSSPALRVALTGSSTANYYANFLSTAAPNNSTHSILLGPQLADCAYLQYNYVSGFSTNNYASIGNTVNPTAFKMYPSTGLLGCRKISLDPDSSTTGSPALQISLTGSYTSNFYATFLSTAAPNNSTHSIVLGPQLADCAYWQYNYVSLSAINNYVSIGNTVNPTAFKMYPSTGLLGCRKISLDPDSSTTGSPALQISLTGSYTSNFYATFLSTSAPNNSTHSIVLGPTLFDCAYWQYNYVSLSAINNYVSIGNAANQTAFKFFPSISQFDCGIVFIGGQNTINPVLSVSNQATASSILATFLQPNAVNGTNQKIYFGQLNTNLNCAEISFIYNSLGNSGNYLSLGVLAGTNTLQIKGDLTFATGTWFSQKINYLNWEQGVPQGSSAIVISPSIFNGESSISFLSGLNNTGVTWKVGHNINNFAGDTLCFYNSTYGNNVGYMNTAAYLVMRGGLQAPNLISDANLTISATTNTSRKIIINAGSSQSGGVYINSGTVAGSNPSFGSTNIGNQNLGNSLFVGLQQETYLDSSVSANGIVNICAMASNRQFITFYSAPGMSPFGLSAVGSIEYLVTLGVTQYNTTSDYRVKENVQNMENAVLLVNQLRPVTYSFLNHGSSVHGFIAHEVQEVFPEAVSGEKDAVDEYGKPKLQQISLGNFTPILTKAIQELHTMIQDQQTIITSLLDRISNLEKSV